LPPSFAMTSHISGYSFNRSGLATCKDFGYTSLSPLRVGLPVIAAAAAASILRCIMDNVHRGLLWAGSTFQARTFSFPCKTAPSLPVVTLAAGPPLHFRMVLLSTCCPQKILPSHNPHRLSKCQGSCRPRVLSNRYKVRTTSYDRVDSISRLLILRLILLDNGFQCVRPSSAVGAFASTSSLCCLTTTGFPRAY
jgi:hypothetical protein